MATRRGKFGRLPRVAPNLTSTIVAIAREMQGQRDSNIMDAWANGGDFEGKPATDDRVLGYWKDRLQHVDSNDPLANKYRDQVVQLTYKIAQSKADLQHVQGKLSDGAYAQFFIGWAKKVPQNSEFWRELQRDGAQLIEQSKAKSKAAAEAAKRAAYQGAQAGLDKQMAGGIYLQDVVAQYESTHHELSGNGMQAGDPAGALSLLGTIQQDPTAVLYRDQTTGKAVTGADIIAQLGKLDPRFNPKAGEGGSRTGGAATGPVTFGYLMSSLNNVVETLGKKAAFAGKNGYATDKASMLRAQGEYTAVRTKVGNWPVEGEYETALQARDAIWNDSSKTSTEKYQAGIAYANQLYTLAGRKGIDPAAADLLKREADALSGRATGSAGDSPTGTFGEAMGIYGAGKVNTAGAPTSSAADETGLMRNYEAEHSAYQQNVPGQPAAYVYVQGTRGPDGAFDPSKPGTDIGVVPANVASQIAANAPTARVPVSQGGGPPVLVQVSGQVMKVSVADQFGNADHGISVGGLSANVYTYMEGGQQKTMWSYQVPGGDTRWTTTSPFANNPNIKVNGGSVTIDSAWLRSQVDANPSGFQIKRDANTGAITSIDMNPDSFVFSPSRLVTAQNGRGGNAWLDYSTPLAAAAEGSNDKAALVQSIQSDPTLRTELAVQSLTAAGNDPVLAAHLTAADLMQPTNTNGSTNPGAIDLGGGDSAFSGASVLRDHERQMVNDRFAAIQQAQQAANNVTGGRSGFRPPVNIPELQTPAELRVPSYTPAPAQPQLGRDAGLGQFPTPPGMATTNVAPVVTPPAGNVTPTSVSVTPYTAPTPTAAPTPTPYSAPNPTTAPIQPGSGAGRRV